MKTKKDNRITLIKKMRLKRKTLEEIGVEFGVTRERIRQLCKLNNIIKPKDTTKYYFKCIICNKKTECLRCQQNTKFCSKECRRKKIFKTEKERKESRRRHQKISQLRYYNKIKNTPEYKAKQRKYSERAYKKIMSDPIKREELRKKAEKRNKKIQRDPILKEKRNKYFREKYKANKTNPEFIAKHKEYSRKRAEKLSKIAKQIYTVEKSTHFEINFEDNRGRSTLAKTKNKKTAKKLQSKFRSNIRQGRLLKPHKSVYKL